MNHIDLTNLLKKLKVLYVEDDPFHREQLASYLKRRVDRLYLAENGEDGLLKAYEYNPDLIITDLKMPGMDGVEMTRRIRMHNATCPVIITTALSDVEIILQAVDVGIDKYVLKPINIEELIDAIGKIAQKVLKEKFVSRGPENLEHYTRAERKEMELEIKNEFARFLKENTGKGPKKIHVFFKGSEIEVKVIETLTLFEKKLIENSKNKRLVDYNREIFYLDRKSQIEEMVSQIINLEIRLQAVKIDSMMEQDSVSFVIR